MDTNTPNPADVAPPVELPNSLGTPSNPPLRYAGGFAIFTAAIPRGAGTRGHRASKYPLDQLEVGQYFELSNELQAPGIRSAALKLRKTHPERRFSVRIQIQDDPSAPPKWIAQRIA